MATNDLSTKLQSALTVIGQDVKALLAKQGDLTTLTTTQKASLVVAINEVQAAVAAIDVKSVIDDTAASTTKTYSSSKIASEITSAIGTLKSDLLGGAGEAYDTLKELADLIANNKSAIDALGEIAAGHVRFDQAQTITDEQKLQARTNIGAASQAAVEAAQSAAEAAQSTADTAKATADTATTNIGTIADLGTTAKTLVGAINEVNTTAKKGVADAATAQTQADKGVADAAAAKAAADAAQGDVDALELAVGDTTVDFAKVYTDARDGVSA